MSVWTGAARGLEQFLAQREVERQQALIESVAADDRRRRIGREDEISARQRTLFEQGQADRAKAEAEAADVKRRTEAVRGLDAQRQASLNVQGTADPMGAQATRNALAVALRVAGAPQQAETGLDEDRAAAAAKAKQTAVEAFLANPTDAGRTALEARFGVKLTAPPKPDRRTVGRDVIEIDDAGGVKKLYTGAPTSEGGGGGDDVAVELTPAGLNSAAMRYLADGTLPPMGYGKKAAGARTMILNRAAEIDPNAAIAANKVEMAANRASLTGLQKQSDAIEAFENTALKNLDVFIEQAGKIVDTGSPFLNRPVRALANAVGGSPEQAAFRTAGLIVTPELAKILQNPSMGGVLTDSARHEIAEILDPNATTAQIHAAAKVLKQDLKNRKATLDQQRETVLQRTRDVGKKADEDIPEYVRDPVTHKLVPKK